MGKSWLLLLLLLAQTLGAVTLGWDSSPGATGYKLYWGTTSRTYTQVQDSGPSRTNRISGLNPGTRYYIAVTAYNDLGESGYSEEIQFIPSLSPPAHLWILPETLTLEIQGGPFVMGPWAPVTNQQFWRGVITLPE